MNGQTIQLSGAMYPPASGGKPKGVVVLLHGLGADGEDLINLALHWAPHLPDVEFIAPDAPEPCDMSPMGYQWFSLQDRSPPALIAGAERAAPVLHGFIDQLLEQRGIDESRLALVGFSQGTMMSLYVGLQRKKPLAGIVGFSGALIADEPYLEAVSAKPPVLLIHGEADPVVPFQAMDGAKSVLEQLGVPVAVIARPGLGHSIDETGLSAGGRFLIEAFRA